MHIALMSVNIPNAGFMKLYSIKKSTIGVDVTVEAQVMVHGRWETKKVERFYPWTSVNYIEMV